MRKAIVGLGLLGLVGCSEPVIEARTGIEQKVGDVNQKVESKKPELKLEEAERKVNILIENTNKSYIDFSYGEFAVHVQKHDYNGSLDCDFLNCYDFYGLSFFLADKKDSSKERIELTFLFERERNDLAERYAGSCISDEIYLKCFSAPAIPDSYKLIFRELLQVSPDLIEGKKLQPNQEFQDNFNNIKRDKEKFYEKYQK